MQSVEASIVFAVWAAQFTRIVALVASPLAQLYKQTTYLVKYQNRTGIVIVNCFKFKHFN